MTFKLNRQGIAEIAGGEGMRAHMQNLADDAAAEIERRAPSMVKTARSRVYGRVVKAGDGWSAEAVVKSAVWHWPEYGTAGRHFRTPEPYIRPGVQAVLSRSGGRFSTTRK